MCKTPIGTVSESGLLAAIRVLEERMGMDTAEFQRRYADGELDHLFVANHWDHLLDALAAVRQAGENEEIVAETRRIVEMAESR